MSGYKKFHARDIPQTTEREYDAARRKQFPGTSHRKHATEEIEDDYETYSELTKLANRLAKSYHQDLRITRQLFQESIESADVLSKEDQLKEFEYYKKYGGLSPEQHSDLLESAFDTAFAHKDMVIARQQFMDKHPYGYSSLRTRIQHIGYIEEACDEWVMWDKKARKHAQNASDITVNSSVDQYGRLRPRYSSDDPELPNKINDEARTLRAKHTARPENFSTSRGHYGLETNKPLEEDYTYDEKHYSDDETDDVLEKKYSSSDDDKDYVIGTNSFSYKETSLGDGEAS